MLVIRAWSSPYFRAIETSEVQQRLKAERAEKSPFFRRLINHDYPQLSYGQSLGGIHCQGQVDCCDNFQVYTFTDHCCNAGIASSNSKLE